MAWTTTRFALLAAVLGCFAAACAVDTTSERANAHEAAGGIELALTWTGGHHYSVVDYRLENEDGELYYEGTIDISEADYWVTKYVEGIWPGSYVLRLHSVSDDGGGECHGRTNAFTVSARETSYVNTLLLCRTARNTGAVSIQAQFDDCTGGISSVTVEPLIAAVGETMSLVVNPNGGFAGIEWSASSGTIDYPGSPEAQYTCTEIGSHTITVSVGSDQPDLCAPETREVTVNCTGG